MIIRLHYYIYSYGLPSRKNGIMKDGILNSTEKSLEEIEDHEDYSVSEKKQLSHAKSKRLKK